jgi:hypothetical protein
MPRGRKPKNPEINGSATGHDDHAENARLAVEQARLDREDETIRLTVKTLKGDLRDWMLNRLNWEQDQRPWSQRTEAQQRETIAQVEAFSEDILRRIVEMVSTAALPTIRATLKGAQIEEDIKLKIVMDRSNEQRHAIMDAVGGEILLISANAEIFMGQRAPAAVKKDQLDIEDALVTHSDEATDKIERRIVSENADDPAAPADEDDDLFGGEAPPAAAEAPVKRGRGRPPKTVSPLN